MAASDDGASRAAPPDPVVGPVLADVAAVAAAATICVVVLAAAIPAERLATWAGVVGAVQLARLGAVFGARGRRRRGADPGRWTPVQLGLAWASAVTWGSAAVLIWPAEPLAMVVVAISIVGLAAAGAPACGPRRTAAVPHAALMLVPLAARLFSTGTRAGAAAGALVLVVLAVQVVGALGAHADAARVVRLRQDNARLTGEVDAQARRLEELARQDPLSGIPNRRHFDDALEREWLRALRQREPIAVLIMDIDHLKDYNDDHGRGAGDQCLRDVAQALHATLRSGTDVVCRYSGEEFAAILAGSTLAQAINAAERFRQVVLGLAIPHGRSVAPVVTLSVGVAATIPTPEMRVTDLVGAADRGLYAAKRMGRDRVDSSSIAGAPAA